MTIENVTTNKAMRAAAIPPIVVTIKEACRVISLSKTQIYRLISRGQLQVRKAGKRSFITLVSLNEWVDSLPVKHPAGEPADAARKGAGTGAAARRRVP